MRNKTLVAAGSVLLLVLAVVAVVLRRARTEHPPVAATVPRLDDPVTPATTGDAVGPTDVTP